jgi:hypothetical protein
VGEQNKNLIWGGFNVKKLDEVESKSIGLGSETGSQLWKTWIINAACRTTSIKENIEILVKV